MRKQVLPRLHREAMEGDLPWWWTPFDVTEEEATELAADTVEAEEENLPPLPPPAGRVSAPAILPPPTPLLRLPP